MGPLEFIYYLGYSLKKTRQLTNPGRLAGKVISVGNLTVGGTGKTPAVIAIAEEAGKRGLRPCILTRGYKGKKAGPCFVSKGDGPLLSATEAGDEAFLMAGRLKGVSIVKCRDRYEGGLFALQHLQSEIRNQKSEILFVLDDGFQHWKLHRDKDVLLIDGSNPFGNRRLLPLGPLREPLKEMKRADVIAITKVGRGSAGNTAVKALVEEIKEYNPHAPVYVSEHSSVCLMAPSGGESPLGEISGKKVFFFCGIADPSSFKESLQRAGAEVKGSLLYRDHHNYSPADFKRIQETARSSGADWIVTTEKDIIKVAKFKPSDLVALRIGFEIERGFYEAIFRED